MSRAQKIARDISFESVAHDIYNPKFSSESDQGEDADIFEDEEAEGQICDERLSELNPCANSQDSDSSAESEKQKLQQKKRRTLGGKGETNSSNKTEIERCPMDLYDSENLQDEDIRESLAHKQRQRKVEAAHMATLNNEELYVMETP